MPITAFSKIAAAIGDKSEKREVRESGAGVEENGLLGDWHSETKSADQNLQRSEC